MISVLVYYGGFLVMSLLATVERKWDSQQRILLIVSLNAPLSC